MRSSGNRPIRRYWLTLFLLIAGVLLGIWHNRSVASGRTDPLSTAVQIVITPPVRTAHAISRWFTTQTSWLFRGRSLANENLALKQRVEELERQNTELTEMARRYEQLRYDLDFVHTETLRPLAADVIAHRVNADFDTIVISRGMRDGVHQGSVVRTRTGLVGKVSDVSPWTATVILLTDPNGAVGGRVQRPDARNCVGVCKGDYTPLVPMIDLPNDSDIREGDLVVTSGFATVVGDENKGAQREKRTYPKGIPIGRVEKVREEEGGVGKIAKLRPVVDFARLEEVYVLQ